MMERNVCILQAKGELRCLFFFASTNGTVMEISATLNTRMTNSNFCPNTNRGIHNGVLHLSQDVASM